MGNSVSCRSTLGRSGRATEYPRADPSDFCLLQYRKESRFEQMPPDHAAINWGSWNENRPWLHSVYRSNTDDRQAGCTKVRDENSPFGIASEEDCCVPLRVGREAHIRTAPFDGRRIRRLQRTHVSASVGAEASNSALRRRTQSVDVDVIPGPLLSIRPVGVS